jgi:hypothetical protein
MIAVSPLFFVSGKRNGVRYQFISGELRAIVIRDSAPSTASLKTVNTQKKKYAGYITSGHTDTANEIEDRLESF